jgi:hypothetical protein
MKYFLLKAETYLEQSRKSSWNDAAISQMQASN